MVVIFGRGGAIGGMVAGLNHLAHEDINSDDGPKKTSLKDLKDNPPSHPDYKAPKVVLVKYILLEEMEGLIIKEIFGYQMTIKETMARIGMYSIQDLMAVIQMFTHLYLQQLK